MFQLTDRDALQLSRLLLAYFTDCVKEDPRTPHPGNLTVRELLDDLEGSVSGPEARELEGVCDSILDLFITGAAA